MNVSRHRSNHRYNGPIESFKHNQEFQSIYYNLNSIGLKNSNQQKVKIEKSCNNYNESKILNQLKLKKLKDKLQYYLKEVYSRG